MDKEEDHKADLKEKTIIVNGTREQADWARKEIESKFLD